MMDLIDRKQALKEINERHEKAVEWFLKTNDEIKARAEAAVASFTECYLTIQRLPSAEPPPETCWGCNCPKMEEPKKGRWTVHGEPPMYVIECSCCGQKYFNHVGQSLAKYCSNCGAKMEVTE